MKKLTINGHETRGKEVIELLEMFGGKNIKNLRGSSPIYYYIKSGEIYCNAFLSDDYKVYTLEEYFQKFPFKIGDRVGIPEYESEVRINTMKWDVYSETVLYMVYRVDEEEWYTTEELLDYNDIEDYKSIESKNIKSNNEEIITIDDFKANTKEWLIDKLQSMSKENILQTICNIYDELHKSKYPKTYEECCNILKIPNDERYIDIDVPLDYNKLLSAFTKLLICRDAYWKIIGEETGLNKPWEPVWDESEDLYTIYTFNGEIRLSGTFHRNAIFVFPTEEMRDAFYENFKDLIEKCKELL